MKDIKLLSKNKYLKVPLLYSGGGGGSVLPKGLSKCNAIVTDGDSYIDADIDFNLSDFELEIKMVVAENSTVSQSYWGWRYGTNQSQLACLSIVGGAKRILFGNSSGYDKKVTNELIFNIKNNNIVVTDFENNVIWNVTASSSNAWIQKFYLFAFFTGQTPANKMLGGGKILMFHGKNANGGERNFIPAYCNGDAEITDNKGNICNVDTAGFFDTISKKFFTNDGEGTLSYEE